MIRRRQSCEDLRERNPFRRNSKCKSPETEMSLLCSRTRFQCVQSTTTRRGCGHTGGLRGGQELDHKEPRKSCQNSILIPKGFEIDGFDIHFGGKAFHGT